MEKEKERKGGTTRGWIERELQPLLLLLRTRHPNDDVADDAARCVCGE